MLPNKQPFRLAVAIFMLCFCFAQSVYAQNKIRTATELLTLKEVYTLLDISFSGQSEGSHGYLSHFYLTGDKISCSVQCLNFCDNTSATKALKKSYLSYVPFTTKLNTPDTIDLPPKIEGVKTKSLPDLCEYAFCHYNVYNDKVYFTFEFTVGCYLIEFGTIGMDPNQVIAKLPDIYKKIKENYDGL